MLVNEKEQLIATQIAYADLDGAWKNLSNNNTKKVTLKEAIEYAKEHGANLGGLKNYISFKNGKVSFKEGYEHIGQWVILSAKNENQPGKSGFYGCILDTGESHILACRGSESMENTLNFKQDWVDADLKLLNSKQTKQEAALRKYIQDNHVLLDKKKWVATGHSLGGALADHAAVVSDELGLLNFDGAINFDGPGHSQEYINAHRKALEHVSSKMIHKKASIVGSLLFDLPGVQQDFIQTSRISRFDSEDRVEGASFMLLEHDTKYWVLDKDGNTVEGKQETQEWVIEKISRFIERLPPEIGNLLPDVIYVSFLACKCIGNFMKKYPQMKTLIASSVIRTLLSKPILIPIVLSIVAEIVVAVVIVVAVMALGELILETMEKIAEEAVNAICATVAWLGDKMIELFDAVKKVFGGLYQAFRARFNRGVSYVQNNPYFNADTAKLRYYADRLERINRRLSNLDKEMRALYWQVGVLDIWDILCCNLITSPSYSLKKAKNYLNNTANRLEKAENKAKGYMGG